MSRSFVLLFVILGLFPTHSDAQEAPRDLSAAVEVTAANEVSNLDRQTGRVVSRIDITLANRGESPVTGPLHAVVDFTGDGDLAQVVLTDALGARGEPPYQAQYLDLSGLLGGGGLAPGGELAFELRYSRPSDLKVLYRIGVFGVANRPPSAAFTAPPELVSGEEGLFDASPSTDPDGDELTYEWQFDTGLTAEGLSPALALPRPGVYDVLLRVRDPGGLESTASRTVLVVPEDGFALARTRTLDDCGVPLGGVTVERLDAPGGGLSDAMDGYLVLGGDAGFYAWKFSKPGHLPVWRETVLPDREVRLLASPWMTPVPSAGVAVGPLDPAAVGGAGEAARILLPAGAFSDPGEARLVSLHGQSLPFPLPAGWSPLAAAHLDGPGDGLLAAGTTTWHPVEPLRAGDMPAVVRFDETSRRWIVVASPPPGALVQSSWESYGFQALVVADPVRPPAPVAGAALEGLETPPLAAVTAEGSAEPPIRTASLDPELAKTTARVVFAAITGQASGRLFRADIAEDYQFIGGGTFRPAARDATFFAYQRPGGDEQTLEARFPLRPSRLFSPADLDLADVHAEVFDARDFRSAIFGPQGGVIVLGGIRLGLEPGALDRRTAVELRGADPAASQNLLGGLAGVAFFQLNYSGGGAALDPAFGIEVADADFVLARALTVGSQQGLEPVLRMRSGGDGVARPAEPSSGPRLPGLTTGGSYVLIRLSEPQGIVAGVARGLNGQPKAGLLVRIEGQPWMTQSGPAGGWTLLAPAGQGTALLFDPADGNGGESGFDLAESGGVAETDIQTRPTGPRVVTVSPPDGATKVSAVTPVIVVFSEPVAPATVGTGGVVLVKDGETAAIPAAVSLNSAATVVSLFPINPLDAGGAYRILVSPAITDPAGQPLEGPNEFSFAVLPPENRGEAGQLTIYEPGGEGPSAADRALIDAIPGYEPGLDFEKVVAVGSPGTADPEVPVILVNQSTGITATVLSKPDGSFANFIEATEEDFISAVFVNANGTRITIPASRQKFDDGRVGLYRQGGILEAEADGEPAQVLVEPDSVPSRTVFRLEQLAAVDVLEVTKGVEPEFGKVLGGIRFEEHGERTTVYSDLVFPVSVADLGLEPGSDPAAAAFALTVPREINGTVVYEVIDSMEFRETGPGRGELVTASPPFVGLLLREIAALRKETGLRDAISENILRTIADGAIFTILPIGAMAVPVLLGTIEVSNIHGTTYVETPAGAGAPDGTPAGRAVLPGTLVRLGPPGVKLLPDVFTAGMFIAVSDTHGKYALRLPSFLSAAASATHRRFPGQVARTGFASAGGISGLRADFVFFKDPPGVLDIEDTSPPSIEVRQLSLVATIGDGPGAGIVLDELITDDLRITEAPGPKLISFTSLIGNNPITIDPDDRDLTEGVNTMLDRTGMPTTLHRQWRFQSKRAGRAVYEFKASDGVAAGDDGGGGSQESRTTTVRYTVVFTTAAAPAEDPNLPPRVVSFAWPPDKAENIARGTPLVLRFSRPLTQQQAENTSWLTTGEGARILHVEVAPDFREARVSYWLETPDEGNASEAQKITFTIADVSVAERNPGQIESESGEAVNAPSQFTHSFSFAKKPALGAGADAVLSGMFGGVVQLGSHVWALERGVNSGKLLHYEIVKNGNQAEMVLRQANTYEFQEGAGRPMDLVLIPGYALAAEAGATAREDNYVVVLAGPLIAREVSMAAPKRAHVFRIAASGKPEPFLVGGDSPVLTDTISLITRGRWDPPFLSYLEIGEITSVSLLTFNGLVVEAGIRKSLAALPAALRIMPPRVEGLDLNNDGDFADSEIGEKPPNRGLEFSWSPLGAERIVDYDFSADFGMMGAVTRPLAGGPNAFVMVLGGRGQLDDETARVTFDHTAKRVKILPRQRLSRPVGADGAVAQLFLGQGNNDIVRDIALVSCVNSGGGSDGGSRSVLLVIDITNPAAPTILIEAKMPLGIGTLNSVIPRGDGLLALSASPGGILLLDPTLLLAADADGNTAAIRQQLPGLEANVSTFSSTPEGYSFAIQGNKIAAAITEPTITVIRPRFSDGAKLRSVEQIVGHIRGQDNRIQRETWDRFLLDYEATGLGGNAGLFDPEKPRDPQSHHYVVIRASGLSADADGKLPLAAAAVSTYGRPLLPSLSNRAPTFVGDTNITAALIGYGALRVAHFLAEIDITGEPEKIAIDLADQLVNEAGKSFFENGFVKRFLDRAPKYPDTMVARRLSDDPTSPLFNTYVAGPIVLAHRDAPKEFVDDGGSDALGRTFLRASPFYWVGLAPTLKDDPFVGGFASRQLDTLDLSLNASTGEIVKLSRRIATSLRTPAHPIMTFSQIALQCTTLVEGEFQRLFQPGHVALVNSGFRRNPVVFIPGVMASRLINPTDPNEAGRLRWLSMATAARAHARELISSVSRGALKEQTAAVEEKLNERMADLTILPPQDGGAALPVQPLDTEDILRTVGLGQVVEDIRSDSILQAIGRAVSSLLSLFGADISLPGGPHVTALLNKINKPIYEPLLLYLNGYLGMDEYKHTGRGAGLRLRPGAAADPESGLPLDAKPNWKSLETGPELFVFPYDWRLDNAGNAKRLERFIDLINAVHPDAPKVDIVCHSMGGLVARRYVMNHPDRVDRFISVASPYLGATKTLLGMKSGDMGDKTMGVFVPEKRMRILSRHMPSVHQLLPNKQLIDLGLPVLQENGWDLDGDGNAYGALDYDGYRNALDGTFFRIPPDEIAATVSSGPSGAIDRAVLEAQPMPISRNNHPFHQFPSEGSNNGQANWSGDRGNVRYIHFVCMQNQPATIMGLSARPVLIPEKLVPDISLSLPPVGFFDSEEKIGAHLPILPDEARAIKTDPEKTFRVRSITDVMYGGGDGTVPLLSQTRGYGLTPAEGNLNAPEALMFPIHNPRENKLPAADANAELSREKEDDSLAGHNDCMRNRQLWAWIGKALQDEIVGSEQPKLTVSGGAARANEPITFTASVSNNGLALTAPPGRAAPTERIVWDMGDGAVHQGGSVNHIYRRPGHYTVTCTLSYQPGALMSIDPGSGAATSRAETLVETSRRPTFGAVASARVVVSSNAPPLAINGPDDVAAGAASVFQLDLAGRSAEDVRKFRWDFGDGTPVDVGNADNYAAQHVYLETGSHTITAEILDRNDAVLQQATKQITVHQPGAVPQPSPPPPQPAPDPPESGPDRGIELVELQITGHTADSDDIEIRHDNRLIHLGTRVVQVSDGVGIPAAGHDRDSALGPAAQSIIITRDPPDVRETTIRLFGERQRVLARFHHFRLGRPVKTWYHRFFRPGANLADSELVFTIRWDDLPALRSDGLPAIASDQTPYLLAEAAVLREADNIGPNLNALVAKRDGEVEISGYDNAILDGEPVGDGSDQPDENAKLMVGLPFPPGAELPDDRHPLEDTQVSQALTRRATRDAVPGAFLAEDRCGNPKMSTADDRPDVSKELTDEDITTVQNAVMTAFIRADEGIFLNLFLLNKNDMLIFEQGSGALLWKSTNGSANAPIARTKINGVYVKGSSDNDYELFLPVFTDGRLNSGNPSPLQFANFVTLAHQPDIMEGNWYFRPPVGLAIEGGGVRDLGPPPDPEDADEYKRYVSVVDIWLYQPPAASGRLPFQIDKGQLFPGAEPGKPSVFDHPATPAQIIAALLTHTVAIDKNAQKTGLRDILPDVSFFPFRREHFEMAMLSLEKPPPFGDDPIGDAGMGRQSLLLKWLLEGAFLPRFHGFNQGVPNDLELRSRIFERLLLRKDLFGFEGYEWGVYQQWAVQREAANLRMNPRGGEAAAARERCRQVFGSYLDAHDDKVMKKLGKACIRATLARMVIDGSALDNALSITPAAFDANPQRRSFEHVVLEVALAKMTLFPGFNDGDLRNFLGAKIGDPATFERIRRSPGGIDAFTVRCHEFLTMVQEATADSYVDSLAALDRQGRLPERVQRGDNALAIDMGFTGLGGKRFSGRAEMAGYLGNHQHRYSFVVNLTRNTSEAVGPLAVTLETEGGDEPIICLVDEIPADVKSVTLKHKDANGDPALSVMRAASDFSVARHTIALDAPAATNGIPENDTAHLESVLLEVPVLINEELLPRTGTRWVFRGLELPDRATWEDIERRQLANGELWSPSRLKNIQDETRRTQMLAEMQARIDGGQGFEEFTNAMLRVMTDDQLLAVNHLGQPPDSLGISTAERIETAIGFAEFSTRFNDVPNSNFKVLVAMEVAVGQGVEYVNTDLLDRDGTPVPRTLNADEGDEVVFLGTVPFVRLLAWEIDPLKTPALNGDQTTRMRPYQVVEFLGDYRNN